MKSSEHACIFCDVSCGSIDDLVLHVFKVHRKEEVLIGKDKRRFSIYFHTGHDRVLCFCGQRFTCASAALDAAPFFQEWATKQHIETNSYAAHLRREGGLKKHLDDVRLQAQMDKIAGPTGFRDWCEEREADADFSFSFLHKALGEMTLDKVAEPPVE